MEVRLVIAPSNNTVDIYAGGANILKGDKWPAMNAIRLGKIARGALSAKDAEPGSKENPAE